MPDKKGHKIDPKTLKLNFQTNLNDITPQFAATGMALANTFGSIMGFIAPAASGHMLSSYGKVFHSFS